MNDTTLLAPAPRWLRPTRWLHALIALSLTTQLILSEFMAKPDHLDRASELEKTLWEGHEWIGLFAAGALVLHWVWSFMSNSDVKLGNLFPWSTDGFKRIKSEVSYLIKARKLPAAGEHGGLAGFIHGLGILIGSAMAATGVGLYIVIDYLGGPEDPLFEQIAQIHGFLGTFMWIYLVGHVLAVAWHEYLGEKVLSSMRP